MKRTQLLSTLFVTFLIAIPALHAQYATNVTVTNHNNSSLAKVIDKNASQLLTAFNTAFFTNKEPNLNFGGISKSDKETIYTIWEITPFRCIETELIERLYNTSSGYQVRKIPVYLKGMPEDDSEREVVLNFGKSGEILDIYFALHETLANEILNSENNDVKDLNRRKVVLDFVENYRTAHNRRDIDFISQIFSNDALIITGRVLQAKPSEMNNYLTGAQIEYQSKTKAEYH